MKQINELRRILREREQGALTAMVTAPDFQARLIVSEEIAFLVDVDDLISELEEAWGDRDEAQRMNEEAFVR